MKVLVKWREGQKEVSFDKLVTVEDIVASLQPELPYEIITCLINREYHRLNYVIQEDTEVFLSDIRDKGTYKIYQSSLLMVYIKAVHDVLGEDVGVLVNNALNRGIYTTIKHSGITKALVTKIENRMRELVEMDIPFVKSELSREEMLEELKKVGNKSSHQTLKHLPNLKHIHLYSLGNELELFFTPLTTKTSHIKQFELRKYKNGILVRFAQPDCPGEIPPYENEEMLYKAFAEETRWGKITGIQYSWDVNKMILRNQYVDLILLTEALHEKKIAEIATQIFKAKKRIILIAGPSSSGKTTFAKRLCMQLRVNGLRPLYMGTDDYFVERTETPIGPDGKPNFEDLDAVDINLFTKQMNDLLDGKKVDLPSFDFIQGTKIFGNRITSIDHSQPIVIEGIHALNPDLTKGIDDNQKYHIYISPLTQLNIDEHNRISTTDARMLRRIVRDYQFRGYSAAKTIETWPSVRRGEEKNIFPYYEYADTFFNSQCLYELACLKRIARPLLEDITPDDEAYSDAQRMLEFLDYFAELEDFSAIPNNSIMREFIGGSILV
ncbi:MAG: hypothetical protein IKE51_00475 [Solobacterium sp.]|nr:hypothetical protein [Solobacterium sp.]